MRLRPLLLATFAWAGLLGQEIPVRDLPKVQRAPRLVDFLEGRPREAELVITDLRQYGPVDGAPVSAPTTVHLSQDDKAIYAVFVCKDDPAKMSAHVARRDQLLAEDRVSIAFDTFHDHHRNVWFDVNPYGCQMDGMTIDGEDDFNWDAVWHAEAQRTQDGYIALIAVPFSSLRRTSAPEQTWGFIVARLITRNSEIACFPHLTPKIPGWTNQFGHLRGVRPPVLQTQVDLIPYMLGASSRVLLEPAEGLARYDTPKERRAGLDAKVVFGSSLTLDATVRPDFSQVESDEPQVTVNQRFEVIYPEKRPFFLENANYFHTPTPLFLSRRILDPRGGARLTGRLGPWGIGILGVDDHRPSEETPEGQEAPQVDLEGRRARLGVVRVMREFGREGRLGVLFTGREVGPGFNRLVALDTRFRVGTYATFEAQAMGSRTRRVDGRSFSGGAGLLKGTWGDGSFSWGGLAEDRGTGFHTDLGYLDRVGIRRTTQDLGYTWRPTGGTVVAWGPTLHLGATWDRGGQGQHREVTPGLALEFTHQGKLSLQHSQQQERYRDLDFHRTLTHLTAQAEPLPWLAWSLDLATGTGLAYDPAPGLKPFAGQHREAKAGLTLRPLPRFSMEHSLIFSQLRTASASGPLPVGPGTAVFTHRILRAKYNLQFSRTWSLRAILDASSLTPDTRLLSPDLRPDRSLGVDLLLTWFLQPGTALYLGWTDQQRNLALDPEAPGGLRLTPKADTSVGRMVYLKASWRVGR